MQTFKVKTRLSNQEFVTLTGNDAHHLIRVLRVKVGENIQISDADSYLFLGTIIELAKDIKVKIIQKLPSPPQPYPVHLFLSLIKSDKIELVIQKSNELNIQAIHFLISRYSEIKSLSEAKWKRFSKIIEASQKQCGRIIPLDLHQPIDFNETLQNKMTNIICDAGTRDSIPLRDMLQHKSLIPPYALWIGPEGGWHEDEVDLALKNGFHIAKLGPLTMRAETAALCALSSLLTLEF